jgi:hypothetical protein
MNGNLAHLDIDSLLGELRTLAQTGLSILYHGDADGAVSAALISRIVGGEPSHIMVATTQLDLLEVARSGALRTNSNCLTVDVNVRSVPGALERLSAAVAGTVLVVDDHLGAADIRGPSNVRFVDLLPPGRRASRREQIRPSVLLAHELTAASGGRSLTADCLAVAALYAEGVADLFVIGNDELPRASQRQMRRFGRGLTALLLDRSLIAEGDVIEELCALADRPEATLTQAARVIAESNLSRRCNGASQALTEAVAKTVASHDLSAPWILTQDGSPVFRLEVATDRWIVNLVASEARNRIRSGVAIALQNVEGGMAVELRRTRDLHEPDLAALLLSLPAELFKSRGGHPMAAGATVHSERRGEFLERLGQCFQSPE